MMKRSRLVLVLALALLALATTPTHCNYHSHTRPAVHNKEKVTRLHFYHFNIMSATNPTVVEVAHANGTNHDKSPMPFSSLWAMDNPLREGPNPKSKVIGDAQGLYVSSVQDESKLGLTMYLDYGFTTGMFKGSSFGVFSRVPVSEEEVLEVAVVGGRGKFRMARGFAMLKALSFNHTNGDAILEYNVTIFHY